MHYPPVNTVQQSPSIIFGRSNSILDEDRVVSFDDLLEVRLALEIDVSVSSFTNFHSNDMLDTDCVMRRIKNAELLQNTAAKTPKSNYGHMISDSADVKMQYKGLEILNEESRSLWFNDSPLTQQHERKEDISLFCDESSLCHISPLQSSFSAAILFSNSAFKPDEDFNPHSILRSIRRNLISDFTSHQDAYPNHYQRQIGPEIQQKHQLGIIKNFNDSQSCSIARQHPLKERLHVSPVEDQFEEKLLSGDFNPSSSDNFQSQDNSNAFTFCQKETKISLSGSTSGNTENGTNVISGISIGTTPVSMLAQTLKVTAKNQRLHSKKLLGRLSFQSKNISKKDSIQTQLPNPPSKNQYACPICRDRFFFKAQALGGHMSKSHPHQSAEFTKKQTTRKEREQDRELLKRAKAVYRETYPFHDQMQRGKLNQIKAMLIQNSRSNLNQ